METKSLALHINTENSLISKSAPSQRVLEVLVRAPASEAQEKRAPLNLALVLDRSGSMHGEKLEYVRQAAAHVLDLLTDGDRAAVVAYDDQIQMVAESTPITRKTRENLKRRVAEIQTGGSTNLSGGWLKGGEQVALNMDSGEQVNRTLLLTDGLANAGITDPEMLAVHARELAARGVSTSTFGVGNGYNEHLLEAMAQQGRGAFYFISQPVDIPQIFAQEFEELSAITARDVEVELDIPAGVEAEALGGLHSEAAGQKLRLVIGSLAGGREQAIYLNLKLPPFSGSDEICLKVVARGKGMDGRLLEAAGTLAFRYAEDTEVQAAPALKDVLERAAQVRIAQVVNEALKLEHQGEGSRAARMVEQALAADREHLTHDQVAYHEKLIQRMDRGLEELERKSLHYESYLSRSHREDRTYRMRTGSTDSSTVLMLMMDQGAIRIHHAPLLFAQPAFLPRTFTFDRIEGMLLGLAVGDALGNTSESMSSSQRRALFGEITGYLPNHHAGGQAVGLPSDDTQLAFWTIEAQLEQGKLDPELLARRFSYERIFGIGSTMREFLRNFKDQRMPWQHAGVERAGNGALMRIAPVLLPHLRAPSNNLWADAVLAGTLTHNDYASNAACVAFTAMLWELLGMETPPAPEWWVEAYTHVASDLEGKTSYRANMAGVQHSGPIWQFAQREVTRALAENWTTEEASNRWGSGAYLLETVPNVLYILARYGHDPEQAIIRAVNDTWDNDSVAAIVGAAVGALHGRSALPERWLKGLLGRTNDHNDGHIFRLINEARMKFWER